MLEYEPDNRSAMLHLARIAVVSDDLPLLESLVRPFAGVETHEDRRVVELLVLHALAAGDGAVSDEELQRRRLARLPEVPMATTLNYLGRMSRSPAGVLRLANLGTESWRDPDMRIRAHLTRADLYLATGRPAAAGLEVARAERLRPGPAPMSRAHAATLPFLPVAERERRDARAALQQFVEPDSAIWLGSQLPDYASLRFYLLGLLTYELEGAAVAQVYVDSLLDWRGDPLWAEQARSRAFALRAAFARDRGEDPAALAALDSIRYGIAQFRWLASLEERDRWLRAELLVDAGRTADALAWFTALAQSNDIIYLAPAHLRRAQLHEQRGERDEAALHYARFAELWRDCEPELRPLVDDALRRLAALREYAHMGTR